MGSESDRDRTHLPLTSLNSGHAQLTPESLLPLEFVLSEAYEVSSGLKAVGFLVPGTEFLLIRRDRLQTALIQALVYALYGCLGLAPLMCLFFSE